MLIPKIPIREYAPSSFLIVTLSAAYDILCAMLVVSSSSLSQSINSGMFILCERTCTRLILVPNSRQPLSKKIIELGAMSSCSVQTLVNHLLFEISEIVEISARYT